MLATKRFQTSALIDAARCPTDTFRAWRNRNGLFPETQGTGKWNRFSFVDVMITAIVADLAKRGISAQLAVDAAMASAPLLANLSEMASVKADDEVLTVVSELLRHWKKHELPILVIDSGANRSPEVRLLKCADAVELAFASATSAAIIVRLENILPVCMSALAVFESSVDYTSGGRRPREDDPTKSFAQLRRMWGPGSTTSVKMKPAAKRHKRATS